MTKSLVELPFCNRYLNNLFIQLNENDDPCICGHPGPSCQPVASIKTRSIQSFKEKKSKHKTKHLKQHPGKLRTGSKFIFFRLGFFHLSLECYFFNKEKYYKLCIAEYL